MSVLELGLPWAAHSADMLKQPHGSVGAKGSGVVHLSAHFQGLVTIDAYWTQETRATAELKEGSKGRGGDFSISFLSAQRSPA